MSVRDAVLLLEMPGCILKEANDVADEHFLGRARVSLQGFLARGLRENIYDLLGEGVPHIDDLCLFEKLYLELLRDGKYSVKGLLALHYTTKRLPQRAYDIFLVHAKLAGEKEMSVRLMPFPSTMMLRITCNSEVCMVEVPPLYSQMIPKAEVNPTLVVSVLSQIWEKVEAVDGPRLRPSADNDFLRYLKLRLPLEELEEQDAYLGSVRIDEPFSESRYQAREELHGQD